MPGMDRLRYRRSSKSRKGTDVSEQTPPPGAPLPPQPPQPPQQSFGEAPRDAESFGSAPPSPEGSTQDQQDQVAPKKKSPLPRIIIFVVIAIVVAAGAWYFSRDDAVKAEVGQCLAGTTPSELDADKLKIVDCSAADAGFKVVQRVEGKNYADSDGACTDAATEFVFWSGEDKAKAGTTLCLARAAK
jgi:hypothetical protein